MDNKRNPRLRKAVKMALGLGLTAAAAIPAVHAAGEEEAAELERVQVTGSRITRLDLEGALPVTVIDREQIEMSGQISVADLLRETTFNSAGSFRPQSGTAEQSFAGVSLRGLGEGRTLILIDGRRAPVAPNVGSAQDLNAVPLAAVERIEILGDGASAVYGSDAIGGVINIITRKDFTGAEVTVGASEPAREGGATAEFSALMGAAGDRGQVMFGVSRNHRDIVFARDREWSSGGSSIFSNNFHVSPIAGDYYFNETHGRAVPGDGCTGPSFFVVGGGTDESLCRYRYSDVAADEAEIENRSLFVRGRYDLDRDWSGYFNSSVNRVTSFGRYAPVPTSPWPGGLPLLAYGSPNHPATPPSAGGLNPAWQDYQTPGNPVTCPSEGETAGQYAAPDGNIYPCTPDELLFYRYDPTGGAGGGLLPQFGSQDLWFTHRFAALGTRDDTIDSQVYDLNLGLEGSFGPFDLDLGFRSTESKNINLGRNYVVAAIAQQFIDSGEYNIYDPFSVEESVANSMIATINRESTFKLTEVYGVASFDLFEVPAGVVSAAFGGEYREEDYADLYDSLSEGGQIVGSAGNSAAGGRKVGAAFFETLVPLADTLEMTLAGRYDRYSDYGADFSPKLSFRWQPLDEMTLRMSAGSGFRAPPLNIITQKPSFGAAQVVHGPTAANFGVGATEAIQITTYSIANPDMESEQSDQFSAGIAFEPTSWFSGTVDFWSIEITNQIVSIGAQRIINCLEGVPGTACPNGLNFLDPNQRPPNVGAGLGMAFQNGPGTPIAYGQTGYTNLGELATDGIDINLRTSVQTGPGQLSNNLQITHVNSWALDGEELVGQSELPEIRVSLQNVYALDSFSFAWNINYIGPQETSEAGPEFDEDGNIVTPDPGVHAWLTHDMQFNWYAPWNGRLTLGVDNVTDEDPPLDPGQLRGFNFNLYDGYGRLPYLRYTQSF